MQLLNWFKERVGKKIVVSHTKEGIGALQVKDIAHAEYLHKTQVASDYSYRDHDEDEDSSVSMMTGVLFGELLASNDTPEGSTDSTPDAPSFEGFGGGSTDGGGAGGSWDSGSDSDSGSTDSSDTNSFDSDSDSSSDSSSDSGSDSF